MQHLEVEDSHDTTGRAMIGVTGATGTIGSHLVRRLSERGERVRAFTRDPERQPPLEGVEWRGADLADRSGLEDAFAGCDRLFLLTGNTDDMVRLQQNALRSAAETGIEHVVKLSALGATDHSKSVIGLWHYNVERELRDADFQWTILRPHHFAQNLLRPVTFDREAGVVYSASGDGAIPFIDTRDIAEVAVVALVEDGHAGAVYTLTGPEAVSYGEATEILGRVLGRALEYRSETPDEAWRRRREAGQPVWLAAAQLAIAGYQRQGGVTARTTDTVREVTGRPARPLETFVHDHVDELGGTA
ncbi:MAG: SDR family oxidoreductase [Longimicrobiales bacterium]|nr:SDR family oxidoreductase [Longimicrobiales bacterium]